MQEKKDDTPTKDENKSTEWRKKRSTWMKLCLSSFNSFKGLCTFVAAENAIVMED